MFGSRRTKTAIRVVPVASWLDHRVFVRVPWAIYKDDQNWVPPLISSEDTRWSTSRNARLAARPNWRFIAYKGDHPVGRVAASFNAVFAERWLPASGFFGFFESEQDSQVAAALLSAVEAQLAKIGCGMVIGPVNLSTQDEVGLLTKGFESRPRILCPYNPPYYRALLENCGYSPIRRYDAYLWAGSMEANKAMIKICRRLERRATTLQLHIRHADDRNWKNEAELLFQLYNECFQTVWGFTPISRQEFMERATNFQKFYRPDLILIAEIHGQPAGFGIVLPDINRVLQSLGGRLFPFGFIRTLKETPLLRDGRFILLGVLPRFQGIGLGALIAHRMDQVAREAGFENVELSLIDSENTRMTRIVEAAGCHLIKSYHLFSRKIPCSSKSMS